MRRTGTPARSFDRREFYACLKYANAAAAQLRAEQHQFKRILDDLNVPASPLRPYADSIVKWFTAWAIIGVRRLLDEDADVHSLTRALNYLSDARNSIPTAFGESVDRAGLREDRRDLARMCKRVLHLGKKRVGHATPEALEPDFTLTAAELEEAVNTVERMSMRYAGLMMGITQLVLDDGRTVTAKLSGATVPKDVQTLWPEATRTTYGTVNLQTRRRL